MASMTWRPDQVLFAADLKQFKAVQNMIENENVPIGPVKLDQSIKSEEENDQTRVVKRMKTGEIPSDGRQKDENICELAGKS